MRRFRKWCQDLLRGQRRRTARRQQSFRRLMWGERLEERCLLDAENIAVQFEFAITQLRANFAPDVGLFGEGGDGEYYFVVRAASSGLDPGQEIFNSRLNELELPPGQLASFGPDNSPWKFQTPVYAIGEGLRSSDFLQIELWDKDLDADDIVDISPFDDGPNHRFVVRLDLRSGRLQGSRGNFFATTDSLGTQFYKISNSTQNSDTAGQRVDSTLWLQGQGNNLRNQHNHPDQVTGAEVYIQGHAQFFSQDTGLPVFDSDGDGLFDSEEGPASGTAPSRPDIFVVVDEMAGLELSPLPPMTGASNTSNIVITSPHHGLTTGATVTITGVQGNTAANATFTVTRLSNDTFSLDGSVGTASIAEAAIGVCQSPIPVTRLWTSWSMHLPARRMSTPMDPRGSIFISSATRSFRDKLGWET